MSTFWAGFFIVGFVVWAAAETYAVRNGKQTLSSFIWTTSQVFPLLPFMIGSLMGGLAVHFWWFGEACIISGTTP